MSPVDSWFTLLEPVVAGVAIGIYLGNQRATLPVAIFCSILGAALNALLLAMLFWASQH